MSVRMLPLLLLLYSNLRPQQRVSAAMHMVEPMHRTNVTLLSCSNLLGMHPNDASGIVQAKLPQIQMQMDSSRAHGGAAELVA